jgi:REP element-mobilizing transposase RayT
VTYLITFVGYGCHLHSDASGSVDRTHNLPGSRVIEADGKRVSAESQRIHQPAYAMETSRRKVVLSSIQERCAQQTWSLLAAHVRTTHVHIVVEAEIRPERIMNDIKAYASRCLNQTGLDEPGRKRWARLEARDGYGNRSKCRPRFAMWSTGRVIQWLSSS